MDDARPPSQLAETYVRALDLHENGASESEIAGRLDIPVEAVAPLLRMAKAKSDRLAEKEDSIRLDEEAPRVETPEK